LQLSSNQAKPHTPEPARPADPNSTPAQTPDLLRHVRLRLRLALLTMAIVPIVLSAAMFRLAIGPAQSGASTLFWVGTVVLGGLMVALATWLSRQVLRPAQQLDRNGSQMAELYQNARNDSLRDALTGLGNHRAFQEELDRELEWYQRYKVPVSLLLIDLDDLKFVNDSESHAAGDDMLRDMGRMIGEVTRYADRAFRIGGDEFAVLMPHTDAEGAMQIAHRLLERALQTRGTSRPMPFSGGISACPQFATTRSQLYAQADAALYWCKRHGRASVDVFHPQRDHAASQEASNQISVHIAKVVNEHLVRPVYQPIVDLESGRVIGFEGLSRPSPESGFSDPGTMFTAAETVGRTVELDLACLHAVLAGARSMPQDQLLTINVSPRTVEAPHFSTDALLAILERHNIRPERVVVELTEREKVEDISRLQRMLGQMQRHGLRIAADDVGAGNAGLRLLSQFRFDIVKIDLALVQEGAERESSRAVLRSLRDLAGRWGASVIAEGLETAGQLRVVRELGLTAGQGYLLARPMPAPDLISIDLEPLELGGSILDRRIPQPRNAPEAIRAQTA
jgi:diguanylate cyclase (GGDEF)-like protein